MRDIDIGIPSIRCPYICHVPVLYRNGLLTYFSMREPHHSSFPVLNIFAKFQQRHPQGALSTGK